MQGIVVFAGLFEWTIGTAAVVVIEGASTGCGKRGGRTPDISDDSHPFPPAAAVPAQQAAWSLFLSLI